MTLCDISHRWPLLRGFSCVLSLCLPAALAVQLFSIAQGEHTPDAPLDDGPSTPWVVLAGPEQEHGKPVEILSCSQDSVSLSVDGRRGTVIHSLSPQRLPATVTFQFQSKFDPQADEAPTELFGTGDFRIFIGSGGSPADNLGAYEGFQLRIFPHLGDSQERRTTGDESHTATSLWIRNIDGMRRKNSDGDPHSGLLSDACQNRGRQTHRHNCGWSRVSLTSGGFGLENGEVVTISIVVTREHVEIRAGHWHHRYELGPSELRLSQIDAFAIGHTNISRGYRTVTISGVTAEPLSQ